MAESTEIVVGEHSHQLAERGEPSTAQLMELALSREGTDGVEMLERLVALQERREGREAERLMNEALNLFQSRCPVIKHDKDTKKAKASGGGYGFTFASRQQIERTIRPILSECGLSYTFDQTIDGGTMRMTCYLSHVGGATRSSTFTGPAADGGSMNAIQKVGSAASYAMRYALLAVLGITTADTDDDGETAHAAETITAKQAQQLDRMGAEAGADMPAFRHWLGVDTLTELPAARWEQAHKAMTRKVAEAATPEPTPATKRAKL